MEEIKIKGPSVKYIIQYIDYNFPERKNEWFDELPEKSKEIFNDIILSSKWYNINDSHINGIKTLAQVFFNGDVSKAAYEMGKFGGKKALSGIYKIFVKIPSLDYVVKKVSTIASTYYSKNVNIYVKKQTDKLLSLKIYGFYKGQELMMPNIAGWIDNLMSIIIKKQYKINFNSFSIEDNKIEGLIEVTFY